MNVEWRAVVVLRCSNDRVRACCRVIRTIQAHEGGGRHSRNIREGCITANKKDIHTTHTAKLYKVTTQKPREQQAPSWAQRRWRVAAVGSNEEIPPGVLSLCCGAARVYQDETKTSTLQFQHYCRLRELSHVATISPAFICLFTRCMLARCT
jgi:hypothetical protein